MLNYIFKKIRIIKWFISFLNALLIKKLENRVLIIYDLSSQPFSIGDLILFQEIALIQCEKYKLEFSDLAIVHDFGFDLASKEHSNINSDNVYYHLSSIISVAQINQFLGSVFIFNKKYELENFLFSNKKKYKIWPDLYSYASRDYLYYDALNVQLIKHFKNSGSIPIFKCRNYLNEWVNEFFASKMGGALPVTVNIRNNNLFSINRNSNMDVWYTFFEYCQNNYNCKFVIVCAINEIDERWRNLKNILVAKDYNTGIEQDLALINSSLFHMGAPSGPISMAWFSNKPYTMFSWDADVALYNDLKEDNGFFNFAFASPNQRLTKKKETLEILISEFELHWNSVELSSINNFNYKDTKDQQNKSLSWLR
jgi:hypothetical protein